MYIPATSDSCAVCQREFDHNSNIIIAGNYNHDGKHLPSVMILGTYCAPCFLATAEEVKNVRAGLDKLG